MAETLRFAGKVGNCVFTTDNGGQDWFVSVPVEIEAEPEPITGRIVGVDWGLNTKATTWDGANAEKINFPNFSLKSAKKLARLQRQLARQEKGSGRWRKTKLKIQKLHRHIANQRDWGTHQVANAIIKDSDYVFFEDLNVRGMSARKKGMGKRGRGFNRAVLNANFGRMFEITSYKMAARGGEALKTPRFAPSSIICSACDTKIALKRSVRQWACPECGTVHDRDVNAAVNIRHYGLKILNGD